MDLGLTGRQVMVTGASEGIGRGVADLFAAEGCRLVLVARGRDRLEAAARALRDRHGVEVKTASEDLSDDSAALRLVAAFPEVDVLVNNAGAIPGGSLECVSQQTWRKAWDLKVFGYIAMMREFYTAMIARQRGVIVNVIGASATAHDPSYAAGSTGNAALEALTRTLGSKGPDHGVRVVGVSPGMVLTSRLEALLRVRARERFGDEARWTELLAHAAFGRAAQVEEIAASVVFLASPKSSYTSGAVLDLDGGFSRRHNWWG
jgi:NAD(P)-dependent dehydrogenase (short-subunit alcohol dehydrogenase family)